MLGSFNQRLEAVWFISKLLIVLMLFIVCIFIPHSVYASSLNLVKDQNNPLNANFFVLQSSITKENGLYKMWFTGHNGTNLKIGYSTSVDWVNWPESQFVSVNDSGDNHDPSLFKHDSNSFIYYISEPSEGSGVDIKVKKSLVTDSQFAEPVLVNLPRQPWNSQKLSCPYAYYENGTYFLFYCGTNGTGWNLGLATSTDGVNFTPCSNNPVISGGDVGNTQIYTDQNNAKHLMYHSTSGITEVESVGPLSCNTSWTNYRTLISRDKPYDQTYIIAPTLLYDTSPKELFYTAKGPATNDGWRLNRAVENTNIPKIVVIPGFFGSWNQEAILHNQTVGQDEWKIPSFVHEYDGIVQTLENLGYVRNVDYFLYAYDWRKPLQESSSNLHDFLQTRIWNADPSSSVGIVGHSMGGLLARIYAQQYSQDNVSKIITVASPHRGVVQVYEPLEAGETKRDNSYLWLGIKLMVNLNRTNFKNDREVVQTLIPSLYDLFPTFNFLKTKRGNYVEINSMNIRNNLLSNYFDIGSLSGKTTVIYGNKTATDTPQEIVIAGRAAIDLFTKDYPDGRPSKYISGSGDYLVPTISSKVATDQIELPLDHGELIYKSSAIRRILDSLGMSYQENQVREGQATKLSPSLLITAQSPIEMSVEMNNLTYHMSDGIILIPNASSGKYSINIKKMSPGDYTVTVAQIANHNDVWEQVTGEIKERDVNEEDRYDITFDINKATPQIMTNRCVKYKKTFFGLRYRSKCIIKHHSEH